MHDGINTLIQRGYYTDMILSKRTISRGLWAYVFFFIALEPAAFQHNGITNKLFTIAQILMFAIMLYLSFSHVTKKELSTKKICLLMIAYYIYFIINTFLNNGRTRSLIIQGIQFIGFALYLDIVLKNNPKELFKSALNLLTAFVAINCLLTLVLKDGLYETVYYTNNYLLGYDNQNINFILPTLVLVLLKNEYYKKCKMQIILTYAIAWITAIRIWSGMTLVVTALMTMIAVFCFRGSEGFFVRHLFVGKIFNFRNFLFADIAANIALVYFRLQYYFEYIIVYVLHRDLTLTSRTIIWDKTIDFIKQRPWFGYGRENYSFRALKYGRSANSPSGLHAHNRLLETIYAGGIVMLALFLGIMFYTANCLYKARETIFAKILSFGIFIYLIGMLTEFYDYCIFLWGFFVMAENIENILSNMRVGYYKKD